MKLSLLVACDKNKGIGIDNKLPWHLPSDMKFFKTKTTGHHILMGRKTFESIGKPLPNRTTLIVTRNPDYSFPGTHCFTSLEAAIDFAKASGEEELFVVGGAEIYRLALEQADTLYITEIEAEFKVDAWLEFSPAGFMLVSKVTVEPDEKNQWRHHFLTYERV